VTSPLEAPEGSSVRPLGQRPKERAALPPGLLQSKEGGSILLAQSLSSVNGGLLLGDFFKRVLFFLFASPYKNRTPLSIYKCMAPGSAHVTGRKPSGAFPLVALALVACHLVPLVSGVYVAILGPLSTFCGPGQLLANSLWSRAR
jgi:hypothetical protein